MNYFAHPTAVIDPGAAIGSGTKIWHFSHIMPGAAIGEDCSIGQNVMIGEGHVGQANFKLDYLSLDAASPNSIIANGGTAIVVHEKADDMKTDPAGNAGNRIACGVIAPTTP